MRSLTGLLKSKWFQALALGFAAAGLVLGMQRKGWLDGLELKSYDWRFRTLTRAGDQNPDIVIIAIDDASFASPEMRENFGRWPWRRLLYAGLIHDLNEWGARAIGIDIIFQGADPHAGDDEKLMEALSEKRNVVLGFDFNANGLEGVSASEQEALRRKVSAFSVPVGGVTLIHPPDNPGVDLPRDEFLEKAQDIGSFQIHPDNDGVLRRADLLFRFQNQYYPSLALAIAAAALGKRPAVKILPGPALEFAGHRVPINSRGQMIVRWHGPAFTYRNYPVWKVFNSVLAYDSGGKPEIPPSAFKNKIVLIGATAIGAYDLRSTPFSAVYPGVEYQATVVDNLLRGQAMRETSPHFRTAAILILALGISGVVYLFNSALIYSLISLFIGLGYLAAACVVFQGSDLWVPLVAPLASGALAFTEATITRYATEGREKRQYRKTLMKYLSPQLVETIMEDFNWGELRAEKRDLTVLFSDVRGFTTFSEKFPPETVIATLNEHLNMMVSVIFKHQGTLDKFVGDCVMAFWGAPLSQPNHAELAARAALEMIQGLENLNKKWQSEGRPTLQIGVGINSGEMLFGNIGSDQRMDFTVIGDSVNLGARLESATKELHASIVISDSTYRQIQDRAKVRPLGEISVKGKAQKIVVYELLGMAGETA